MSKKRRQFSREFKLQVIREIESGVPAAQISRQHQIGESLLHKWKKQYRKDPHNAFNGAGRPSSQDARMADLERTIGQLYLENAFLKKTVNHFEMLLQKNARPKEHV
jgi:transposase